MAEIIRGTTPTIKFVFNTISVQSITTAYFLIKSGSKIIIEKDLSTATVENNNLSWKLTQEESLMLSAGGSVVLMCDWKLADGTRGRSKIETCKVAPAGKGEVI